ncbi:hypothetical protein AOC03_07710 [Psychrobacter urativorans]|uniref:Restriction endonuclease n=2 Tax=Psychrobacter urativorans TaxID=45610 RepID=A0A0M3V8X6_9GAMM|nr:hypothetical protein AOC03_07710 [Psychrobacter urativorans]
MRGIMRTNSVITVFEHQRLTVTDFLQAADFAWLVAQEFTVFTIKRQRGQWQLKVGHYIGIIMLPSGMMLEILPKTVASMQDTHSAQQDNISLTRHWVQRMLTDLISGGSDSPSKMPHNKNFGQFSQHLTPLLNQTPPLSQWLATQFLQRLSAYQPSKHYQTQVYNQSRLQGKLLIKEQMRRNGAQPHKFVSEVSMLSQDMLSNRLIKSALLLLTPLFNANLFPKPLLSKTVIAWQHVTALNPHEWRQLQPLYLSAKHQLRSQPLTQQQLQQAQQLLEMAYWLLQGQQATINASSSLHDDKQPTQSTPQLRLCLLINMNQAFEQWASQRIAILFNQRDEHAQPLYQTLYQPRDVWLRDDSGQTCLSIQPDVLIYHMVNKYDENKKNILLNKKHSPHITSNDSNSKNDNHVLQCSHVIDIKWKHLAQTRDISASDAYQLTSYAQAYHAEQVWLIYPVTDHKRQPVLLTQAKYRVNCHAGLWLMPFNVLTGTVNQLLSIE